MRDRIQKLVAIAATNGSSLSIEELFLLLPEEMIDSRESLRNFISQDSVLRDGLTFLEGEIVPKGAENLIRQNALQMDRSSTRIGSAQAFISQLSRICPWIRLAGVSGSVAYNGSKPNDDIDVFMVVGRRRLWISLFMAMALAKANRLRNRTLPIFCFNRILDEERCAHAFRSQQGPLFAREALTVKILEGDEYYQTLLASAGWMETFFPRLYHLRLSDGSKSTTAESTTGGVHWAALDLVAYLMLGSYLWLINLVRNRRLESEGNWAARFRTIIFSVNKRGPGLVTSADLEPIGDAKLRPKDPGIPIVKLGDGQAM